MTDREMLELAAKAAGYGPGFQPFGKGLLVQCCEGADLTGIPFSPLTDDGDCARMEAQLGIDVCWFQDSVCATAYADDGLEFQENCIEHRAAYGNDRNAARRRASTRAAAAIGASTGDGGKV